MIFKKTLGILHFLALNPCYFKALSFIFTVHCHIGSLEMNALFKITHINVHCHIGSLEMRLMRIA